MELSEDVGLWREHHSSDESHVLAFLPPPQSEYHLPLLAEKNPLADEGFTLGAVTQSISVGWGSRAKASAGAAESRAGYRSSLPGLLLLESPFPEILGDLWHRSFKKHA